MVDQSPIFRFSALGALYVSQALPLGFFIVAIPAILRLEGLPLEQVGLLSALAFPWLLKFLWAPWVDKIGSRHGHYRSWLLPLQMGCVISVAWIAALDLAEDSTELLLAGAVFMLLSATQDIATDGLAVHILTPEERPLGNGIQVGGYYLGQILGGGVALILYSHFGWAAALGTLALILALPMAWVLRLKEPAHSPSTREGIGISTLGQFFRRPGILSWVGLLLLWRAAETMAQFMFNPMLVDRGYALEEIGLLLGIVGSLASLLGALMGGLMAKRQGRKTAMVTSGTLLALALSAYVVLGLGYGNLSAIYATVIAGATAAGVATAALYTGMMDRSKRANAATDFTLQQSLAAAGPVLASAFSGFSAATFGYAGHFGLAVGLQVTVVVLAALTLKRSEIQ